MQRFVPSLIVLDTVAEMCSTVCCGQTKQSVMKAGNEIYRGAFFFIYYVVCSFTSLFIDMYVTDSGPIRKDRYGQWADL